MLVETVTAATPSAGKRTRPARRPDLVQMNKTPEWKRWKPLLRFHSSYTREAGPIAGSPCWVWDGTLCTDGHGRFAHDGNRADTAHRYAVEVIDCFGPLGRRRVTHACRNKACVRPDHLRFNRGPESWPDGVLKPRLGDYSLSPSDVARFRRGIGYDPSITCQLWQGARNKSTGYGQVRMGDKYVSVHRAAYAIAHGSIPDRLRVCHGPECEALGPRGRLCVNPEHLIADTQAANMADKEGGHFRRSLSEMPVSAGTRALTLAFLPHAIEVEKEQGELDQGASIEEMLAIDLANLNSGTAPTLSPSPLQPT